jgi:hypothetical protein
MSGLINLFESSNCKLNDSLVNELKKKLNVAENKLTDIRLEALSSVHQVDQLRDFLDKMRVSGSFSLPSIALLSHLYLTALFDARTKWFLSSPKTAY